MAVPEEIRLVKRPENTVICDSGKNNRMRYSVRERLYVKYVPGKNPQPVNGKVIGHIIDGKYVPLTKKLPPVPEMISYGTSALIRSLSSDIHSNLGMFYSKKEAKTIMAIVSLMVMDPDTVPENMEYLYSHSGYSAYLPNTDLSESSVYKILDELSRNKSKREKYMKLCAESFNGMLYAVSMRTEDIQKSFLNLSEYPYQNQEDYTQIGPMGYVWAYDPKKMEPVCYRKYNDPAEYSETMNRFITDFGISEKCIAEEDIKSGCLNEVNKLQSQKDYFKMIFCFYRHSLFTRVCLNRNPETFSGIEFLNFIASDVTCRIIKKFESVGLLKSMNYRSIMNALFSAMRYKEADINAKTDDECWICTEPYIFGILESLELSAPEKENNTT